MKLIIFIFSFTLIQAQSPAPAQTVDGRACIIPFTTGSKIYNSCISIGNGGQCYCPTITDPTDEPIETANCPSGCTNPASPTEVTQTPSSGNCKTTDGGTCHFPFKYLGIPYENCTTVGGGNWCAKTVNNDYTYKTYGTCNPASCVTNAPKWAYSGKYGPEYWDFLIEKRCDGSRQSPIDLESSLVKAKQFTNLVMTNYNAAKTFVVSQNGKVVTITTADTDITITGGPLGTQTYKFYRAELHWGRDDTQGSEHTYNKKRYPLEVQIVHYNAKYASFAEAAEERDGLAILGLIYEKESSCSATGSLHKFRAALNTLSGAPTTPVNAASVKLETLLPTVDIQKYFTYSGSMNYPPCAESATYIVFDDFASKKFKTCEADELAKLRAIRVNSQPLSDNFRPIQRINLRSVYKKA